MDELADVWKALEEWLLHHGDELQKRINSSQSWEDFKYNKGMTDAVAIVYQRVVQFRLNGPDEGEEQ